MSGYTYFEVLTNVQHVANSNLKVHFRKAKADGKTHLLAVNSMSSEDVLKTWIVPSISSNLIISASAYWRLIEVSLSRPVKPPHTVGQRKENRLFEYVSLSVW